MCRGCGDVSRRPRTWPWPSGRGSTRSFPRDCCGRSASGRRTRTGQRFVITREAPPRRGRELRSRYTAADLRALTEDEATRFTPDGAGDPRADITVAWELLYRLEPELYDRLVSAERLHPGVLGWLPRDVERIVEVGAGAGRLTLELIDRAREVVAVEPAAPLRRLLNGKLSRADGGARVRVTDGF